MDEQRKALLNFRLKQARCRYRSIVGKHDVGERNRYGVRTLPPGTSAMRALMSSYKFHAKARGYDFDLTEEEFLQLTQGNCFYCDKEPLQKSVVPRANGSYVYNGIDRVNNEEGYFLDNCVPCCGNCNSAKMAQTQEEYYKQVINTYKNCNLEDYDL